MEIWETDCSKGWLKTLGERLVKSNLNKFVPLGRALSCPQTAETWEGCRMLQLVAWTVCSLNTAMVWAQHWRRQPSTALASGKVRTGWICPEKALLKVTSGQSAESSLGGVLVQPVPMMGVQPSTLGCGAQQGQHASSAQISTSKESLKPPKSSHMGRGSWNSLGRVNSSPELLSYHHVLIFQVIKVLERDLPSSLSCPCSIQHPSCRCCWLWRNSRVQALFAKGKSQVWTACLRAKSKPSWEHGVVKQILCQPQDCRNFGISVLTKDGFSA